MDKGTLRLRLSCQILAIISFVPELFFHRVCSSIFNFRSTREISNNRWSIFHQPASKPNRMGKKIQKLQSQSLRWLQIKLLSNGELITRDEFLSDKKCQQKKCCYRHEKKHLCKSNGVRWLDSERIECIDCAAYGLVLQAFYHMVSYSAFSPVVLEGSGGLWVHWFVFIFWG